MNRFQFFFCCIVSLCFSSSQAISQRNGFDSDIVPLQAPVGLDKNKVALGKQLFHERRLSKDDAISCAHCHGLDTGGVDNLRHSFGVNGGEGGVNTPTVYNTGLNLSQFWDGRSPTLEDQVNGPTHNPVEMASNWKEIIGKLKADPSYVDIFNRLYGQKGLTADNIRHAIAEYERSLVTVDSPFDRYLQGDLTAISSDARKGYTLFQDYGCTSCHQGANVGGNMYQVMGVFGDYFKNRRNPTDADLGRYNVTGRESDRGKFKVPSLRLVTLTAPYFHDGSVKDLSEAIRVMAKYQLGRTIPDDEIKLIVAFLHSLVGKLDKVEEQ